MAMMSGKWLSDTTSWQRFLWRNGSWLTATVLMCLALWPLNRAPLFYVDTAAYLAQGNAILDSISSMLGNSVLSDSAPGTAETGQAPKDDVVIGSRSATYAVFLTLLNRIAGLGSVLIVQSVLFVFTVWLAVRLAARSTMPSPGGPPANTSRTAALMVGGACLGSAPFYTIYLMPDIFTPMLILLIAALTLFTGAMRPWEMAAATLIGAAAVTTHPSNMLIGGLLLAGATLVAIVLRPRRGWLGLLLVTVILATGFAERAIFTTTTQIVRKAEVIYLPFLTVRFIVDGPGMDRLASVCPDPGFATCALYDQLKDHPLRMSATKILFDQSEELGSFARLDQETQKRISQEQGTFFADVAKTHPVGVGLAILGNAIDQIGYVSIIMNLPIQNTLERMARITATVPESLYPARWTEIPSWLTTVEALHRAVYWIAGILMTLLLLQPRNGAPLAIRGFAIIVVGGVVANALVCGGISQPAERYGARVIFLLPMMAVMLAAFLPFWRSAAKRNAEKRSTAA